MKIKKIVVKNFKAVDEANVDFNGCSAIVTAGNNKGKSSILKGLIDRLLGEKPEIVLKRGENKGFNVIHLTDGSIIEWHFTEKSERFSYTTKEGIKQTTGVLKTIGERLFGQKFDIDKFLNASPRMQLKALQRLLGVDLEELEIRYKEAYDKRTECNRILKEAKTKISSKPEEPRKPNIEGAKLAKKNIINTINVSHDKTRLRNRLLKNEWQAKNKTHIEGIEIFNNEQSVYSKTIESYKNELSQIENYTNHFIDCFDFVKAEDVVKKLTKPLPFKNITSLPEPTYQELTDFSNDLEAHDGNIEIEHNVNVIYQKYLNDLGSYKKLTSEYTKAEIAFNVANELVISIQREKKRIVEDAKFPDDFSIKNGEIYYQDYPLSNNQTSSSSKYVAALKLGYFVLGEIRTMHFDASYLDKKSLSEIQDWSVANNLQLLIERPDYDGGEIKYEIIK